MSEINPAAEYHKDLAGLSGIRRPGMNASKQNNEGAARTSKVGSASAREAAYNASIDHSEYQGHVSKSLLGLPLTGAPVGSEPGNKYTLMPSNRSGSTRVGG